MKKKATAQLIRCGLITASLIIVLPVIVFAQNQKAAAVMKPSQTAKDQLYRGFVSPPDNAQSKVYWFWIYNRVTKAGITRDLEEFKAKGISGVNMICNGGYAGKAPLPGVAFLSDDWRALFRHAIKEAKRLRIEFGFNLAGGWTMMGPLVAQDDAMKKIVSTQLTIDGGKYSGRLAKPETVEGYYHEIIVQAFPLTANGTVEPMSVIDVTAGLQEDGRFEWDFPKGKWVILRSGYTLTGHPWSKWKVYPEGDTFEGGEGYQIDYLSKAALTRFFNNLGKTVIAEAKKAGGKIDYLWSDSWECGKLTWTQQFRTEFKRFRGYDLMPYLPVLAGFNVSSDDVSSRFREDFDRTIQDCIAENFYGHFATLCHKNGIRVGNEAGGPNDIPPMDVLKNFSTNDIVAGEFWVNGHSGASGGYNKNRMSRINLKQTATAAHVYGKRQAEAEAFTEQQKDATHWTLGPSDLKPYANDAFCEGINRLLLHSATCQPPSDGKPGYEYCAGTHFTPNITWWEQSPAFFNYLNRCQYMLQQGLFVADICFYLGDRPPLLVPPKYNIPDLGGGYDCDYSNPDVLLNRMAVKNGRIVLPDGMSYKLLILQNCVSPVPEIAKQVGNYQGLQVPSVPSKAMSVAAIKKIKVMIEAGATVVGAPPENAGGLAAYQQNDAEIQKIAHELWGELDGRTRKEKKIGKGRLIWGMTAREVLLQDCVVPDFTCDGQDNHADDFDYIHRRTDNADIYFVINRTNQHQYRQFSFRVGDRMPEIWDAVTGKKSNATAFTAKDGVITLPLDLDVFGSTFVVFSKPLRSNITAISKYNFPALTTLQKLQGNWKVSFNSKWGGPVKADFPQLVSWTSRPEEGIKFYSGTANYTKTFDLEKSVKGQRVYLELTDVKNVAQIRLNGKSFGVLWCAPWRVDITEAVKPTGNALEIAVTNLWCNRVIHDLSLPLAERITKTHEVFRFDMLNVNTPTLPSGLLGPVKLMQAAIRKR